MIGVRKNLQWIGSWSMNVSSLNQKQPPEVFYKKGILFCVCKIHRKKHLCQSPFLNKVAGPRPY